MDLVFCDDTNFGSVCNSVPSCAEGIVCPPLNNPSSGGKSDESRIAGTVVVFYCSAGYHLSTASPLLCADNERWNGTTPDCLGNGNNIFCFLTFMHKDSMLWSAADDEAAKYSFVQ